MANFSVSVKNLGRGLRPSKRNPRDNGFLTTCSGAVGRDGVLQAVDEFTRMVTDTITDAFPYPQIFIFDKMIIVCSETVIYEWVGGALVSKLTVTAGTTWRALQFGQFIYMSNAKVAVTRDPLTKAYTLSDQPVASALCNYNGQIIIGAPGVEVT